MRYEMKKFCLVVIITAVFSASLYAADRNGYFWSFGDIGIYWNTTAGDDNVYPLLNIGNLNWITSSGLGWGFHLFNLEGNSNWTQALILPVEINFSPLRRNDGNPILTLYGRGGLLTRFDSGSFQSFFERSRLFGAAGLRMALFPAVGQSWSIYTGGFVEYTTRRELRIGISVDLSVAALIWLILSTDSDSNSGKQKRR